MTTTLQELRTALGCFAVESHYEPNQLFKLVEHIDTLAAELAVFHARIEAVEKNYNARLAALEEQTERNARALLLHLAQTNNPEPAKPQPSVVYCDTKTLTFASAIALANRCKRAPYRDDHTAGAFLHGVQTVLDALEAAATSGVVRFDKPNTQAVGSRDSEPTTNDKTP